MHFTKQDRLDIFETAISWIVTFAMFIYGGGKILQFQGANQVQKTVAEMTGMELMWAFYGYSQAFAITLGILEITGGILLLFKKTRLLGCLFLSAILVNVILQDIFYEVHFGALKAALLYQFLLLIILWLHRKKIFQAFRLLTNFSKIEESRGKWITKMLIAFLLFVVLRIGEYLVTIWW